MIRNYSLVFNIIFIIVLLLVYFLIMNNNKNSIEDYSNVSGNFGNSFSYNSRNGGGYGNFGYGFSYNSGSGGGGYYPKYTYLYPADYDDDDVFFMPVNNRIVLLD